MNIVHQALMAAQAVVEDRLLVPGSQFDGIRMRVEGKVHAMQEAVLAFINPLFDGMVAKMAIHAFGHGVVAAFLPTIEMLLHDVALHACLGIAGQVGMTPSVAEGVDA
jgi:hypothetical protein